MTQPVAERSFSYRGRGVGDRLREHLRRAGGEDVVRLRFQDSTRATAPDQRASHQDHSERPTVPAPTRLVNRTVTDVVSRRRRLL